MATTPEYGEELMVDEREHEQEDAGESYLVHLPRWEDLGETEAAEQGRAEAETHRRAGANHEAHRPGAVCDRCGAVIGERDDVRLTVSGQWVHEVCPPPAPREAA